MVTDHTGLAIAHHCRFCGGDVQGPEIPPESRQYYGTATHFSKIIGIEYGYDHPGRYDGVSEWMCPYCQVRINRWTLEVIPDDHFATHTGNHRLWKVGDRVKVNGDKAVIDESGQLRFEPRIREATIVELTPKPWSPEEARVDYGNGPRKIDLASCEFVQ